MMAEPSHPLFARAPLRFERRNIDGWRVGDRVLFPDPNHHRLQRPGTVIAMLPRCNKLILRATEPDAIVDIEPSRCRKVG